MRAAYYDPTANAIVRLEDCSPNDIRTLIDKILSLRSESGHPTLQFSHGDGSGMLLSTDGKQALVVWVNALHESFHSVGGEADVEKTMIFDTFGTWSEAPGNWLVPLGDAIECAMAFARTGKVGTERVIFEPD
jgi:hypothetical protein